MKCYGVYLKDANGLLACESIFLRRKDAYNYARKMFVVEKSASMFDSRVVVPDWEIAELDVSRTDGKHEFS